MLCDGNPDPLNTRELNTYMNLCRDDKEYKSVPVVLSESEGTLKVIEMLQKIPSHCLHSPSQCLITGRFLTEVINLLTF